MNLWSAARRSPVSGQQKDEPDPAGVRSPFQHDHDRLLFSTPVRRLSDKTQVWPMDENDGVRTRLTHSHEVANLARSIGTRISKHPSQPFKNVDLHEAIQPILSAIGLAHDLGNPAFGHQGEVAIGQWFNQRKKWIFTQQSESKQEALTAAVPGALWPEFTDFDGNPQTLRLITQLQTSQGFVGLDLTAATLAASLKYAVATTGRDKGKPSIKKFGYFDSEAQIVAWIRKETGLQEGQRHPLTWIMEACDDIAYSVLDTDDLLKKEIISPDDVLVILRNDPILKDAEPVKRLEAKFQDVAKGGRRSEITRDIKIGYVRAYLIEALIKEASDTFIRNCGAIFALNYEVPLMEKSVLCSCLKGIARQYAFSHRSILRTEAMGVAAIDALMTAFWDAISLRQKSDDIMSSRVGGRARYVYSLISPNYLEEAHRAGAGNGAAASMRYRELRLLTDMVSGMTDTFAIKLWRELEAIPDVDRH